MYSGLSNFRETRCAPPQKNSEETEILWNAVLLFSLWNNQKTRTSNNSYNSRIRGDGLRNASKCTWNSWRDATMTQKCIKMRRYSLSLSLTCKSAASRSVTGCGRCSSKGQASASSASWCSRWNRGWNREVQQLIQEFLVTNNNGLSLMHACEASGLILANTFIGGGPTCWTPDESSSHCIDFIAIPQELRPQIALCRVKQVLGRRWQMSLVRDHWPVEVHVRLPKPWKLLRKRNTTIRWNKHALQVVRDDPHVAQAFPEDASRAWAPFVGSAVGIGTAWDLQDFTRWLFAILVCDLHRNPRSCCLPLLICWDTNDNAKQSCSRLLVAGVTNLWDKGRTGSTFNYGACFANIYGPPLQPNRPSKLTMPTGMHGLNPICNLLLTWGFCRQLAGHGAARAGSRAPPAAQLTSARQWETHMAKIWGAERHHAAVVDRAPGPNRIFPDIPLRGQLSLHQLWLVAKSQKRFKATPDGALPAELWQLLLGPDTLTGPLSMQFFEQMQWLGCNPQSWCDGQSCVLPKPGGVPGPDGLDPAGKLFHKALLGWALTALQTISMAMLPTDPEEMPSCKLGHGLIDFEPTNSPQQLLCLTWPRPSTRWKGHTLQPPSRAKTFQMLLGNSFWTCMNGSASVCLCRRVTAYRWSSALESCKEVAQALGFSGWPTMTASPNGQLKVHLVQLMWQWSTTEPSMPMLMIWCALQPANPCRPFKTKMSKTVKLSGNSLHPEVCSSMTEKGQLCCTSAGPVRTTLPGLPSLALGPDTHQSCRWSILVLWYKPMEAILQKYRKESTLPKLVLHGSLIFKKRTVPSRRKALVFKAMVNESLLSALEVRTITRADEHHLEQARGLLLRRLFGRDGFGAVAGDNQHRSVTLSSLRTRPHLATISSELCVRCLLWLRSSLLAEQQGQVRLELATLFRLLCSTQEQCSQRNTNHFCTKVFAYLASRLDCFDSWFLWRCWQLERSVPGHTGQTCRSSVVDTEAPPVEPAQPPAAEVVFPLFATCVAKVRGKIWERWELSKFGNIQWETLCRPLPAHFAAGSSLAKQLLRDMSKNSHAENPWPTMGMQELLLGNELLLLQRLKLKLNVSLLQFSSPLASFFVRHAGPRFPLRREPNRPCFQARSSRSSWEQPSAELSQDGGGSGLAASEGVWARVCSRPNSSRTRCVGNTHLHPCQRLRVGHPSDVSHGEMEAAASSQRPSSSRWTSTAHSRSRFGQWLLKSQDRCQVMTKLAELHDSMTKLEDMSKSIQLCFAKSILDGRILLKIRPRQSAVAKDVAPVGPLARDWAGKQKSKDPLNEYAWERAFFDFDWSSFLFFLQPAFLILLCCFFFGLLWFVWQCLMGGTFQAPSGQSPHCLEWGCRITFWFEWFYEMGATATARRPSAQSKTVTHTTVV